ncbi:MAG: cobyrinate a,c-diamide synthase [Desulfobacteraceae bacterium]|nr:cobyrinate a,c-diamide synthase [Desulfobacteraceae bacterium]
MKRIIISALRGGAGKTLVSLGIVAGLRKLGLKVAPFKKGPDYIDAGWLALAADRPCYNLDTFLIDKENIRNSFLLHTKESDIAVTEGNRGLYDGIDNQGTTSTAELAKLLDSPVILSIDCTKSTRTMAAAVLGCMHFDPEVKIKGVILNRVAGARHENILRKSIEHHCGIPVFGAVPKLREQIFPERHMGLVPTPEHTWANDSINAVSKVAEKYIDLRSLTEVGNWKLETGNPETDNQHQVSSFKFQVSIGIIRDSAFQFYYPENIEALISRGADIVYTSPLKDKSLPRVDALYIGGGFPETHAKELAENTNFKNELKKLAENGLPIYAECGGLMYLGEELILDGKSYPMTGVLPVVFGLSKRPQGHGYTVVSVERENPYFKTGSEIRGHEFHYSSVLNWRGDEKDMVFSMKRGVGFKDKKDGVCYKNVLATYTHIHALGLPSWADAMIRNAVSYQQNSKSQITNHK